jgi:hypothetical protein
MVSVAGAGPRADQGLAAYERKLEGPLADGPLERLLHTMSPLDRLIADAGPLAKFRTDPVDGMPAGTSAFTARIDTTRAGIDARFAMPHERVLGTTGAAPQVREPLPPSDPLPAAIDARPADAHLTAPKPEVHTRTDNDLMR